MVADKLSSTKDWSNTETGATLQNGATLKIGATLQNGATLKIGATLQNGATLIIGATLEWHNTEEWLRVMDGATVMNGAAALMNGAPRCFYCWNPVVLELMNGNLRSSQVVGRSPRFIPYGKTQHTISDNHLPKLALHTSKQ